MRRRIRICGAAAFAVLAAAAQGQAARAACRVTDFLDRPLAALSPLQRLAFAAQMTDTEFAVIKRAGPGGANADPLILQSASAADARQNAQAKIDALRLENGSQYQKAWAVDALNGDGLRRYIVCASEERPGVFMAARPLGPGAFDLVFAHYLPIGTEKVTLKVVASDNIANIADLKAVLKALGPRDYFEVQTFGLKLADASQPAVLILRAGYEQPKSLYIPAYPPPDVR
jgi:hypothetical protein